MGYNSWENLSRYRSSKSARNQTPSILDKSVPMSTGQAGLGRHHTTKERASKACSVSNLARVCSSTSMNAEVAMWSSTPEELARALPYRTLCRLRPERTVLVQASLKKPRTSPCVTNEGGAEQGNGEPTSSRASCTARDVATVPSFPSPAPPPAAAPRMSRRVSTSTRRDNNNFHARSLAP